MKTAIVMCVCLATLAAAQRIDYTGHKVIRVVPQNENQLQHLFNMQSMTQTDFWSSPSMLNRAVDMRVSPTDYSSMIESLASVGLSHTIHVNDVGKLIQDEQKNIIQRRAIHSSTASGRAFDFANYHTYDEIVAYLSDLSASNQLVSTSTIGVTGQGRNIVMATVSSGGNGTKAMVYMDCLMHAREWAATASCVWMINQLATNYGVDADITKMVDAFDWAITPISNPDGYAYSWATDRLWRKNRSQQPGSPTCYGTDPNRNFDAGFGGPGTSPLPCADTYRGPYAFSEPESAAMRDVLVANSGRVKSSISIHTYSQLWMSPYGYQSTLPADYDEMYRVMTIGVNALQATYGTVFDYGNIADTIYLAAGSTADYAYDVHGVIYAFALELRDTGIYGFQLPPAQILPTATETFNGIKAVALEIVKA